MKSPFAGKRRTQDEIIADLAAGKLDLGELKLAEVATIEKIDCSGEDRRLVETVTVVKRDGEDAEVTVVKH